MRGRLINRMFATFGIVDTASMVYDTDYHAPFNFTGSRVETFVTIPAQIEEASWFRATFRPHGLEQDGELSIILHYADLETAGLVDSGTGSPLVNIGSRLVSIARETGEIVRLYPDPPGLYVIQSRDSSWGLSVDANPTRNLLFLLLAPRPMAV